MIRRNARRAHAPRAGTPRATRRAAWLALALATALAGCSGEGSSDSDAGGGTGGDGGGTVGGGDGPTTGTGGSTARMTISRNFLYAISGRDESTGDDLVQLFDISTPTAPNPFAQVLLQRGLETLFPYNPPGGGDYLLVGAEDGVYVLDNTDVGNPRRIGTFEHARAEDPVVARNGYAYVTLRDAGFGVEGANTMSVVDVRDLERPTLVTRISMQGPRGLTIGGADGNRVYVCDGRAGLKIFDISDPADPVFAGSEPDLDCLDVIAFDGRLHAITTDELVQYDAATDDLVELSRLGVGSGDEAAFARDAVVLR